MFFRSLTSIIAFLCICSVYAQYKVDDIPSDLAKDVDAVIREMDITITLEDYNEMNIIRKEVITVFNRNGMSSIRPFEIYDKSSSIKDIEAKVYDKSGRKIQHYKKRDFKDISATGENLYTDSRSLYINFIPRSYPFTFEFVSEIKSTSTAFLPKWDPSPYYNVSTQHSKFTLINKKQVPVITRKYNLEDFNAEVEESPSKYEYSIENLPAVKKEELGPHYTEFTPVVKIALQKFQLKGESANVKSWTDFGLWQNDKLLRDRDVISEATKAKIENLVSGIDDPREKAKLIYQYVQDKTRYVSVQVGIGGWQPSPASEVDELSYGDCKGLTNYTKALLKSQGIESYYTIVDAGANGRDLDEEFVALQGNHVILSVPFEDETVFLECTSQKTPFNYMGDFTDDRKVLMVTPEGGVISRTPAYETEENVQHLRATATLSPDLKVSGVVESVSGGVLYGDKYLLETSKKKDQTMYYKELWGHLNNLTLDNITFDNNKNTINFKERLNFQTDSYVSTAGDRILLNPNIFSRHTYIPEDNDKRNQPIKIRRGKTFRDTIEILLPEGYTLETAFDPIEIESPYGSYAASIDTSNSTKVIYKREFVINSGTYSKDNYQAFIGFFKNVMKKDKSKIVLIK